LVPELAIVVAIVVALNSEARAAAVSQSGDCSRPELLVEIGTSGCAGNSAIEHRCPHGSESNARPAVQDCYCPEWPHGSRCDPELLWDSK
jgi:hypothetical protein